MFQQAAGGVFASQDVKHPGVDLGAWPGHPTTPTTSHLPPLSQSVRRPPVLIPPYRPALPCQDRRDRMCSVSGWLPPDQPRVQPSPLPVLSSIQQTRWPRGWSRRAGWSGGLQSSRGRGSAVIFVVSVILTILVTLWIIFMTMTVRLPMNIGLWLSMIKKVGSLLKSTMELLKTILSSYEANDRPQPIFNKKSYETSWESSIPLALWMTRRQ